MTIQATLCFILRDNKVLLLKKSKGLFGQDKWNAPGGKILPGEDAEQCAVREVREETQLAIEDLEQTGILHFYKYDRRESPDWTVHVFLSRGFDGIPVSGREGQIKWFNVKVCLSKRCGKTTDTGPSLRYRVEDLKDGSTTRVTSRTSSTTE